jgi:protein-disulfide isomerase
MKMSCPPAVLLAASVAFLAACSGSGQKAPSAAATAEAPVTATEAAAAPPVATTEAVAAAPIATQKASSSARGTGGDVVAEVNGEPILATELEEKASGRLASLRQQEYEIRSQTLDELIADRLIDDEAKKQGLSRDALLRREVEARFEKPAKERVETLYQQNKDRFAGKSKDEALVQIEDYLTQRARSERRTAYEKQLRDAARVVVRLEVPRVAVAVPKGAPATGPASAPVTIVEFTDYQCPYCHRAQSVIDELLSKYKGRVRLVHLDFPLDGHPQATPAARAARCAGEQGRFWPYHHDLMTEQGPLDDADLKRRAAALQLDVRTFATCLASRKHDAAIQASVHQGEELGVTGTPAYFINGRMVSGARPLESFTEVIDSELAGR